jgi:ribokinase
MDTRRILNFGSINIDHVYGLPQFVAPGETLESKSYRIFPGGKGFNQSIALAGAGVPVFHAGRVGPGSEWLIRELTRSGVDVSKVGISEKPTGHAVIQVVPSGENAIIIYGGANGDMDAEMIPEVFSSFKKGDWLLVQNEINAVAEIIRQGHDRGMNIAFNPAPMTPEVLSYPLDKVDVLIVNRGEGAAMTGADTPEDIIDRMVKSHSGMRVVLTLGELGAVYKDAAVKYQVPAPKISAVDTTAAGDTFIGFFIGALMQGKSTKTALTEGCCAGALCATRLGAASAIPDYREVLPLLSFNR